MSKGACTKYCSSPVAYSSHCGVVYLSSRHLHILIFYCSGGSSTYVGLSLPAVALRCALEIGALCSSNSNKSPWWHQAGALFSRGEAYGLASLAPSEKAAPLTANDRTAAGGGGATSCSAAALACGAATPVAPRVVATRYAARDLRGRGTDMSRTWQSSWGALRWTWCPHMAE